jgi:site-specific DNA-methyltransferase (adenine-specific)
MYLNKMKEQSKPQQKSLKNKTNSNIDRITFKPVGHFSYLARGDCLRYLKKMKDNSVDLILTDPPYNLGLFMHKRKAGVVRMRKNHFAFAGWDDMTFEDWSLKMGDFFSESSRILKKRGSILLFMSLLKIETIVNLAQEHGFYYKTTGIWHKTNPMPRNKDLHFINSTEAWVYLINKDKTGTFNNDGRAIHDFIETPAAPLGEKKYMKHSTQKPEKLVSHFISILTNENDLVVDPFMGSGTTGVVCERHRRNFIGIESNKEFFSSARKRIANANGAKL